MDGRLRHTAGFLSGGGDTPSTTPGLFAKLFEYTYEEEGETYTSNLITLVNEESKMVVSQSNFNPGSGSAGTYFFNGITVALGQPQQTQIRTRDWNPDAYDQIIQQTGQPVVAEFEVVQGSPAQLTVTYNGVTAVVTEFDGSEGHFDPELSVKS